MLRIARLRDLACVAVVAGALVLAAPALAKVFSSGNLSKKIPQVGLAKSKIKITKNGDVSDVNVEVRASHSYTCDLIVGVQGPASNDGFTELMNDDCNGNDDDDIGTGKKSCAGDGTVFDDEAATDIGNGSNPYQGSFRPEESLSEYDGESAKGTWTLYVFDINQHDAGTLHCWKLNVKT